MIVRLRPDFDRTATGYLWLDRLTASFWHWMVRRADRLFEEEVGIPLNDFIPESSIDLDKALVELDNPGFDEGHPWADLEYDEELGEFPPMIPYEPDFDDNRPPDRRP